MEDVRHPEHALVELDPVVHPAELDVADDVVDVQEADAAAGVAVRRHGDVAGQERAAVVGTVHERVDGVAVGRDRGALDLAELVLVGLRLHDAASAARDRLAVGLRRVGHGQRDVADAVAVLRVVLRDLVLLAQRARDDEADVSLLEHVGSAVAHSRLGARVRRPREAHRVLVEVRSLLCVADPELDVIPPEQRHEVFGHAPIMPLARPLPLTRPARPPAGAGAARDRSRQRSGRRRRFRARAATRRGSGARRARRRTAACC